MQGRLSPIFRDKIQSFPYLNWKEEFSVCAKYEINHIEWTMDQLLIDQNPLNSIHGRKKIKFLKKKFDIAVKNLTCDFIMHDPFYKSEELIRPILEKQFLDICKNASQIKIKNIVIPLVDGGKIESSKNIKNLINFFYNYKKTLITLNLNFLFEFDFSYKKGLSLLKDLEDTRLSYGVNYDMGNTASYGYDPVGEIMHYENYIKNVHIKDRFLNGATTKLGKGNLDIDKNFKALSDIKYNGLFTLQIARSSSGNHIKEILSAKNKLKNYFYD